MSLNEIQLNNTLLSQLYPNSLIQPPPHHTGKSARADIDRKPSSAASVSFLGKNGQQVLILVRYPDVPIIPDASLEFLTTILGSCKLGLADVAILNMAVQDTSFAAVQEQLEPRILVFFDLTPADLDLPIHFPAYQVQAHNGVQYLYGPSLETIESNRAEKTNLWHSLKKLFNL